MKKFLSLALCLCMVLGASMPAAFAAEQEEPVPYWQQAEDVSVEVGFSNGKAAVKGYILGRPGTTKIVATLTLEKQNADGTYTEVGVWSNRESYGQSFSYEGQCAVSRGNFRATIAASVTRNGVTENVYDVAQRTY